MDILETNCSTQLSQSARHDALSTLMEYNDDFSDTTTESSSEHANEDAMEEDDEVPDYHYLGDPHLIDMMSRLKAFRDSIYLPKRISFQEQRETFEQLAAEVVHTHDELQCFFAGEISLLFRRAAKKLLRGIENRAELQVQRFLILKNFEQAEEAMRYPSQCSGSLNYPGASWRSWCRNTQRTPSVHMYRDALKRGNRVLTSHQVLPRGGIHIVHRLLKEGEAFVNSVIATVIGDVERASVIRTQLPDIESVYLYDKTESRHNHVQQKLTATQGDVTYVPGMATFVSEDAWSLATTASMLRRQYSASSERRVFLVMRLGFWTVPGMRMMARSSEWDAQEWYQEL